ncbi:hypothetical protein EV44_g5691 [Erysiphe necator]|uniref:Uncharacterized protein n=1 Tax=Uncinula necator TaxID=52586 RepID=A0A0B1PIV2_UNCNE|nr:hypothetical protein EV44_g5691 [Erysiphe necator]
MTTMLKSHMPFSLSSPSMQFSSSPPATPNTTSYSKNKYGRDCAMSSPSSFHSRSFNSITPRSCRLTKSYTTPSCGRRDLIPTSSTSSTSHYSRSKAAFSARQIKPNPLIFSRDSYRCDEDRATRRKLFLDRVKEAGEEKRWRERYSGFAEGDEETLRTLWLVEQRRWQEQRRREASGQEIPTDYEDLNEESHHVDQENAELEDFLFEEINSSNIYLPKRADQTENPIPLMNQILYNYDDDNDEVYDQIFMEVIQRETKILYPSAESIGKVEDYDEMDIS